MTRSLMTGVTYARAIDEMKDVASGLTSVFCMPKKYLFKRDKLQKLMVSAAEFVGSNFVKIKDNPVCTTVAHRPNSCWIKASQAMNQTQTSKQDQHAPEYIYPLSIITRRNLSSLKC